MKLIVDRLAWVKLSDIDLKDMVRRLTMISKDYAGNDRRISMYEIVSGHFGMPRRWAIDNISKECVLNLSCPVMDWPAISFPDGKNYWSGQKESIDVLVDAIQKRLGGLLESAPGSGKTLMGLSIAAALKAPALVIVHKNDLAEQWQQTAKTFWPGIRVGHVQGDNWDFENCHVVTAMAQTLFSRRLETGKDFWRSFAITIFDEGHRYPARTFERVVRLSRTKYRLGVSATWRRKDGLDFIWEWHIGRVEHVTKVTKLTGRYYQIPWKTKILDRMYCRRGKFNTAEMINVVSKNVPFNIWLAEQCVEGASIGRKILLVSDRIDQLLDVRKRILMSGKPVTVGMYCRSAERIGERKKGKETIIIRRQIDNAELHNAKKCDIILATYKMMAEGTDIPELDTLIFGTPRTDIEQVVGRIQRYNADKRELVVVDPVFQTNIQERMGKKRRFFMQELGFEEKVIKKKK